MTAHQRPGGDALRVVRFVHPVRQAFGLMFRQARPHTAYLFVFGRPVRLAFHMWFVFSPIDLYLLDAKGVVLEKRANFRPFARHAPRNAFSFAIETARGVRSWRVGERVDIPLE